MIAILHFTTLVITTLFAAGAAALVNWLLLRATFQLMRPATAGRPSTGPAAGTFLRRVRFPLNPGDGRTRPNKYGTPLRDSTVKNFHVQDHRKKGAIPCWL
jgi:hypothetical protein